MEGFYTAADGAKLFYRVDDFTDPWRKADTVLLLHGFGESTEAWRAWVPYFMRQYRVVRMDIRGFGQSTPMALDFNWSIDTLLADMSGLMSHLGVERFYLVGAKSGGTISMKYTADFPDKVIRLGVTCSSVTGPRDAPWLGHIETHGVPSWARQTMPGRFGSALSPEAIEWWIDLMAKTPKTTLQGYLRWVPQVDITEDVKKIQCPVLIIAPDNNARRKIDVTQAWQKTIRNSELMVMPLDGWHIGGAYPDICAPAIAAFFQRD